MKHLPGIALVAGSAAGGLMLGIGAAIVSLGLAHSDTIRLSVLLAASALAVAALLWRDLRPWLPQRGCQVRRNTELKRSIPRAALLWGLELGSGIRTFAVTPAFYGFIAVMVAQVAPWACLAGCLVYGISRGTTIMVFAHLETIRGGSNEGAQQIGRVRGIMRLPILAVLVLSAVSTL